MDELMQFLRSRNIPEEVITQLETDKIDPDVLLLMPDEQLKEYLPSYGDRLATMAFCRRKGTNSATRKTNLFDRLKSKLSKPDDPVPKKAVVSNAQKDVRKIEIGWINFNKGRYTQVRTKRGGGTRQIGVSKDWTKVEVMNKAKELFFPVGRNCVGEVTEFEFDVTDFQEGPLDDHVTVGELYDQTGLSRLRFYLKSKKVRSVDEFGNSRTVQTTVREVIGSNQQRQNRGVVAQDEHLGAVSAPSQTERLENEISNVTTASQNTVMDYTPLDISSLEQVMSLDEVIDVFEDSGTVSIFQGHVSDVVSSSLDDTLPMQPLTGSPLATYTACAATSENDPTKIIVVHRGQILRELIAHFSDKSIMNSNLKIQVVHPNGKLEKAVDQGGVLRDVLAEFWQDFYQQCTLGSTFKVPFLRHDFGGEQWESIGRIITFGWQKEKYLPSKIAPVILEQAVLGCFSSNLVDCFLRYVTETERSTLEACRLDFEKVDSEELMEIMNTHSCRKAPSADNFERLLKELAHQKLLQEPAFVIEQWATVLGPLRSEFKDITSVYEGLNPTSRKVMRSVQYPAQMNDQQTSTSKHLNSYLRESDIQHLSLFLRFCTGSDLFLGKTITVMFSQLQGLQRRPVAHTCGCYLELPTGYDNYPDFRHEMNKVLESGMWEMDIA